MLLPRPGPSSLWTVDGNHSFWDALTWADDLTSATVPIRSLEGLVTACAHHVIQNSRALDFLAIFGHGTAGYQATGAGRHLEKTGQKSLRWKSIAPYGESQLHGQAEKSLLKLNGLLTEDATVFLGGCNVGEGDYGTGLLTTMSNILKGRAVQAFEWKVFWWTGLLAGPLKEARGDDVTSSLSNYSV